MPLTKKDNNFSFSPYNIALAIFFIGFLAVFCRVADYPLLVPLLLTFLGIHLFFIGKLTLRLGLSLGFLLTLIVFTAEFISRYTAIPAFYIPVAGISMLTILLFKDIHLMFGMTFASSILATLIVGGNFDMMLTFFIGGLTGAYAVRDARNRGQLFAGGVFVGVIHLVCLLLLQPYISLLISKEFQAYYLYPLAFNGFISAFAVLAVLKIFEYLFGVLTNFSLLELSDFNQPLLKRMVLEAPGTYHHSLVVSNLAEAAADAIGADALLTRVGAYYHDIGKLVNADYFTENQLVGGNKHDEIEPSMSRLVILNHVKEGIELARKHKLNQMIIDFIPQHHGTGLIHFFYQRALEEGAAEGHEVNEGDYRYPGPKPQTRETAITLMADSVEGAVRALDEPNPSSMEETVKKVINNKFIDGQLDECPLTLKEIDKISSTFVRILGAMYHGRVKYPEKKNGTARNGKHRSAPQNGTDSHEHPEENPNQFPSHHSPGADDPAA
jgi:putative nucleotidyltransferase with HDIG domain